MTMDEGPAVLSSEPLRGKEMPEYEARVLLSIRAIRRTHSIYRFTASEGRKSVNTVPWRRSCWVLLTRNVPA